MHGGSAASDRNGGALQKSVGDHPQSTPIIPVATYCTTETENYLYSNIPSSHSCLLFRFFLNDYFQRLFFLKTIFSEIVE